MISLKIRIFENDEADPKTTISIPLGMLGFVSRLVPATLKESLAKKGIDVAAIGDVAKNDEIRGILVEIEEHKKGEKTVVSIE